MTDTAPARPEGSDLVPGWLIRLAAVGWRLLVAIALGLVLVRIVLIVSTVTASILIAGIVAIAVIRIGRTRVRPPSMSAARVV